MQTNEPSASATPIAAAPTKRWRVTLLVTGGVLLFVLLVVIALPPILARAPFRNWLIGGLLSGADVRATTGGATFGWLSPIELRQLEMRTLDDQPLLAVPRIASERSLWRLLFSGNNLGEFVLQQPQLNVLVTDGETNLRALANDTRDDERDAQDTANGPSLSVTIDRAHVSVRGADPDQPQVAIEDFTIRVHLAPQSVTVDPGTLIDRFQLSPPLCDAGLKYVAPILADTAWVQGAASLELDDCRISLDDPQATQIAGKFSIHSVRCGAKSPLVRKIAAVVAKIFRRDPPNGVQLADESVVEFQVQDGRVAHRGLAFGFPEISPDLQIRTRGSVGVEDQTLDLIVEIPLPFHLLGDGPVAEDWLGSQTIEVPVKGTLNEPKIEFRGDGQVASDLLASFADKLTNGDATLEQLAAQLRELGIDVKQRVQELRENRPLLERWQENRRDGRGLFGQRTEPASPDGPPSPADSDEPLYVDPAEAEEDQEPRRRLFPGRRRLIDRRD